MKQPEEWKPVGPSFDLGFSTGTPSAALSKDGNTLVVGNPGAGRFQDDEVFGSNDGQVRVFQRDSRSSTEAGKWKQKGPTFNGSPGSRPIGVSAQVSRDGGAISYAGNNGIRDSFGVFREGFVQSFTFENNTETWQPRIGPIETDNTDANSLMSGDGKTLFVGNRVFRYNEENNTSSLLTELDLSLFTTLFEAVASEDGSTLALRPSDSSDGTVRLFRIDLSTGRAQSEIIGLPPKNPEFDPSTFVCSFAISKDGNTVAIGDCIKTNVVVFRYDGTINEWTQLGDFVQNLVGFSNDISGSQDFFGDALALSDDGETLAVGAPQYSIDFNNEDLGRVTLYRLVTNGDDEKTWLQLGEPLMGKTNGERFGSEVSLSGDARTLLVQSGIVKAQVFSLDDD